MVPCLSRIAPIQPAGRLLGEQRRQPLRIDAAVERIADLAVASHRDADCDVVLAHHRTEEEIADHSLAGPKDALQLRRMTLRGQRLAEAPQRVQHLASAVLVQHDVGERLARQRLLRLAVEPGEIRRRQMRRRREGEQRGLHAGELHVDRGHQRARRSHRVAHHAIALTAVVVVGDERDGEQHRRNDRGGGDESQPRGNLAPHGAMLRVTM
jgi:hypothetical protein